MAETPNVVVKEGGIEGVNFFGKSDINKHGNNGSEMPSWYFRAQKEEIAETIRSGEASLERGEIAEDRKPQMIADIRKMKQKLDSINESEPRFEGKQQDAIDKVGKELGKQIQESMFSRSDMQRGVADAHEEARRMSEPCIELRGDAATLAKKMGCRVSRDGMVSRDDATRIWKLCKRSLGENSNVESLRRG